MWSVDLQISKNILMVMESTRLLIKNIKFGLFFFLFLFCVRRCDLIRIRPEIKIVRDQDTQNRLKVSTRNGGDRLQFRIRN